MFKNLKNRTVALFGLRHDIEANSENADVKALLPNMQIDGGNDLKTDTQKVPDKNKPEYIESLLPVYDRWHNIMCSFEPQKYSEQYANHPKTHWRLTYKEPNTLHPRRKCYIIGAADDVEFLEKCQNDTISYETRIMHQLVLSVGIIVVLHKERDAGNPLTYKDFLQILDKQEREDKKKEDKKNPEELSPFKISVYVHEKNSRDESLPTAAPVAALKEMTRTLYDKCTDLVDPIVLSLLKEKDSENKEKEREREKKHTKGSKPEKPNSKGQWRTPDAVIDPEQDRETACIIL